MITVNDVDKRKLVAWLESSADRVDRLRHLTGSGDMDFFEGMIWADHGLLNKIEDGDFDVEGS